MICPCNSNRNYNICCGKYHQGKIFPATAEALMRSRYSAYVMDIPQYIYRTWDETTRPSLQSLREENQQRFCNLEIKNSSEVIFNEDKNAETATVEFIASYTLNDKDEIYTHHENSFFKKQKNKWLYVSEVEGI